MGNKTSEREPDSILFTGIVVTCNEERYLRDCLKSLSFCDELIVVDLGSTDSSLRIAREAGAKVLHHERVPVVEQVREFAVRQARNEWIVFQDPDEVMPAALVENMNHLIKRSSEIGVIRGPIQFYFKEKPLNCCIWGISSRSKIMAFHRQRISLRPHVHKGYEPLSGYEVVDIPRTSENFIKHYWMSSYDQLFKKHLRYIKFEGEAKYNSGQHFSWLPMLKDTWRAVRVNLINYGGLRGGLTGIFLSFFYGWYVLMSWLSLRKFQIRNG